MFSLGNGRNIPADLLFGLANEIVILSRFILFVKRGYRDASYHNWYHALSVFHFSYLLLKNLRLIELGYIS